MAHLFIYGTLKRRTVIKAITGKLFKRNRAVLDGFEIHEQRTGFPYILKAKNCKVNGFILWDVDSVSLIKIDRYENENVLYSRQKVKVIVGEETVESFTYIGNLSNIRRSFGDNIDETITTRVEEYLSERIGQHIPVGRKNREYTDPSFQGTKEFLECEIQHLLNMYFTDKYVSPQSINENLSIKKIPTLNAVKENSEALEHSGNYLDLSSRFMVFNRLSDIIHNDNRAALFARNPFCMYSLTNLVTLKLLNTHVDELNMLLGKYCPQDRIEGMDYTDYADGAARIAAALYTRFKTEIGYIIREISENRQVGRIPMGAELEFSNVGRHAVYGCRPADREFGNFKHFREYDLLRRLWRLGGHIDDHSHTPQNEKKAGGFLEFALGKNILLQHTSRPVTNDLHLMASLISEIVEFVPAAPYSLHLTFENVFGKINWNKKNDIEQLKCLLLLGGDFRKTVDGNVIETRIGGREIVNPWDICDILVENRQFPNSPDIENEGRITFEFQFPRLGKADSYIPLILGLKGFYLGYRPRPFSSKVRNIDNNRIREESAALLEWAQDVRPVSTPKINRFLSYVEKGLFTGIHKMGLKHKKRFLRRGMLEVEKAIKTKNDWIKEVKI